MAVNMHLVTVVGGYVKALPAMLEHYRSLGVESFFVNVHLAHAADPVHEEIEQITRKFGCGIASVTVGNWIQIQQGLYARQRELYPNDWFVLADQDELQVYPGDLREILNECEGQGFDHVRGCFVDRLASDGRFPPIVPDQPIWDQFPLGGYLTYPILGGDPRKVVAAKGALPLMRGQHHAFGGRACPSRQCYAQVHHFKWVEGLDKRLAERAAMLQAGGDMHYTESLRFVQYYNQVGGQLNIEEPALYIAPCDPQYRRWEEVKKKVLAFPLPRF
jgi:hypothetical protein